VPGNRKENSFLSAGRPERSVAKRARNQTAAVVISRPSQKNAMERGAHCAIRPGDVVWFSPGEKHWHGAAPTTAMTHIAIQEKKDGKVVDWMEHVSDEQYKA
jgi:hypothetical protein